MPEIELSNARSDTLGTQLTTTNDPISKQMIRATLPGLMLLAAGLYGCTSTYLIRGEGGENCSTVREKVQSNAQYRNFYSAWLLGYLTRYNYERDTQLGKGFTSQALLDTALQYCVQKPLDDFDQAAANVIDELRKKQ